LNATASQLIILAAGIVLIFNMVLMCMLGDLKQKPKLELEIETKSDAEQNLANDDAVTD
jgi:hypothetical protein